MAKRYAIRVSYSADHPQAIRPRKLGRECSLQADTAKDAAAIATAFAFMGSTGREGSGELLNPKYLQHHYRCSWISSDGLCAVEIIDCEHLPEDESEWGHSAFLSPTYKEFDYPSNPQRPIMGRRR